MSSELSKKGQKVPPPGFTVSAHPRSWGVFGQRGGFAPETWEIAVDRSVAPFLESRLSRMVGWKMERGRRYRENRLVRAGMPAELARELTAGNRMGHRVRGQGITALGLTPDKTMRMVASAERAAERWRVRSVASLVRDGWIEREDGVMFRPVGREGWFRRWDGVLVPEEPEE
jgi:hypothetical protein